MNALDDIRASIIGHPSNTWAIERGYGPVYTAAPSARIAVIGQAPGRRAQETGIPWNDRSGERLRQWLGITDDEFYDAQKVALLPMDFYYPGKGASGDLPPRKDFAARWHPQIFDLLPEIRLTVLIGRHAQKHYLAATSKPTLTETVRAFREYGPGTIPIVHPSPLTLGWQIRNPWFEAEVVPELRRHVREALGG
ncbi:uracil-DNA glycosylase family protein [Okibacterium endophyticum]